MSRCAVVTGASAGLGRDIALACAAQGWSVAIGARRLERLESVADEIREAGGKPHAAELDVTEPASVDAFFRSVGESLGAPDLVVINAGMGVPGKVENQTADELAAVFDTNVLGATLCARAALPALRAAGRQADIVFMSSDSVERPAPHMLSYGASKRALEYIADGLRIECADDDIRITLVRLGPSSSEFGAEFDMERSIEMLRAWKRHGITMHEGLLAGADVASAVLNAVTAPEHLEYRAIVLGPARGADT